MAVMSCNLVGVTATLLDDMTRGLCTEDAGSQI